MAPHSLSFLYFVLCLSSNVTKFLQTSWLKMLHMHVPHNAFFGCEDWPSLHLGTEELAMVSALWSSHACIKTHELYSWALNQIIFYFDFKCEFNQWDYQGFLAQSRLDSTHQRRHWRQAAESQEKGNLRAVRKQRSLCALMFFKVMRSLWIYLFQV